VSSVEAVMGIEGKIMCIEQCAISSVSRSSKCTKIVGGWGFAQDPTGELTAFFQTPRWV